VASSLLRPTAVRLDQRRRAVGLGAGFMSPLWRIRWGSPAQFLQQLAGPNRARHARARLAEACSASRQHHVTIVVLLSPSFAHLPAASITPWAWLRLRGGGGGGGVWAGASEHEGWLKRLGFQHTRWAAAGGSPQPFSPQQSDGWRRCSNIARIAISAPMREAVIVSGCSAPAGAKASARATLADARGLAFTAPRVDAKAIKADVAKACLEGFKGPPPASRLRSRPPLRLAMAVRHRGGRERGAIEVQTLVHQLLDQALPRGPSHQGALLPVPGRAQDRRAAAVPQRWRPRLFAHQGRSRTPGRWRELQAPGPGRAQLAPHAHHSGMIRRPCAPHVSPSWEIQFDQAIVICAIVARLTLVRQSHRLNSGHRRDHARCAHLATR